MVLIQSLNNSYQSFATCFFLLSQTPGWKDVMLWYGNFQLPGNSIFKNSSSQVCIPAFPDATPTEKKMAHPEEEQKLVRAKPNKAKSKMWNQIAISKLKW